MVNQNCHFYLNSRDATNNAHPTWRITDNSIKNQRGTSLKLISVSFPNYVYPINSANNTIAFIETASPEATYSIPAGVYDPTELGDLVGAGMSAASPNSKTYTMVFDYNTYLFTL